MGCSQSKDCIAPKIGATLKGKNLLPILEVMLGRIFQDFSVLIVRKNNFILVTSSRVKN